MKKILLLLILSINCLIAYADNAELSKHATAFYSDNNTLRTMDMILQINENDRTAQDWLLLGNVLSDNDKVEDSVYMYKKAIEKDKKCYKALYNLGNYYMERGQFDLAIDNYKKATKIKEDNPYIFYNLGCAYLKKENFTQARANFNKAIMYNANVPEFHYNLAYVYKKLNKDKMAQTYLDNYNKLVNNSL